VGGQLIWIKPSGATGKYYSSGFTNDITVAGVSTSPPGVAAPSAAKLNLTPGARNLVLAEGALSAPITIPIRIEANNRVTSTGSTRVSVSINPSTGLFRGSVIDPRSGKALPFQGALFGDWNVGLGYFLNAAQSGQVMIAPAP